MPLRPASVGLPLSIQHPARHILPPRPRHETSTSTSTSTSTNVLTRTFHASSPIRASVSDPLPDHYATLSLPHGASPADIKRQFFTLSKQHHPDHNPSDPSASTRFVQISEAYHVLSVPEKRAQYDAQLHGWPAHSHHDRHRRHGHGEGGEGRKGSYSSASFAGSRPASGLNKKRGTFRGPPPSFYKSGGYGNAHHKRTEYAGQSHPSAGVGEGAEGAEDASGSSSNSNAGAFGGFGPGQTGQGTQVPHFNTRRHKETHEQIIEHIYGRRKTRESEHAWERINKGGMIVPFLLVSGTLGAIGGFAHLVREEHVSKKKEKA
ncbi:hypothetical protein BCR34DRAFT_594117 [Clohesyomyces aquaticus]|uniref:J domain-containing protein n=1 Tax=Clohesyomyces aquaticus TaxID=1231657 RepID=A0A1Y1YCZ5_9PLEO|nr:hypothetical protein BCR34DRAFT_594117 [Clohesyomyces aquaticus]